MNENIVNNEDQLPKEVIIEGDDSQVIAEIKDGGMLPNTELKDYNLMSRKELLSEFKAMLHASPLHDIREAVEHIRVTFYKKLSVEREEKKKLFIEEGGEEYNFTAPKDALEDEIKELMLEYKKVKEKINQEIEGVKTQNLKKKYEILEEIKKLTEKHDSLNKTFDLLHTLQKQWRDVGPVPQTAIRDLWSSYEVSLEKIYDYVKINKELRDLDFKKNLEAKIFLCEKSEELMLETDVVKAFRILQKYHEQWKEIGPVVQEKRDEVWQRFKEVTVKINKKHQDYFLELKEKRNDLLAEKERICELIESIDTSSFLGPKDWITKTAEVITIQQRWRDIGLIPDSRHTKLLKRYKEACDVYFNKRKEFFADNKERQQDNLQLKTELCIQAESLANTTEWEQGMSQLIALQRRWRDVGSVPKKVSDKIWKRFRTAIDNFHQARQDYFKKMDLSYVENLNVKLAMVKELETLQPSGDGKADIDRLKEFQRRWTAVGFVPMDRKKEIQDTYREHINKFLDQLSVTENDKKLLRFSSKLADISERPKSDRALTDERDKLIERHRKMEGEVITWENNILFFRNTKNASTVLNEMQQKITQTREEMLVLEKEIKMIDKLTRVEPLVKEEPVKEIKKNQRGPKRKY